MLKRFLIFTAIVGVVFGALAGCKNDPEQNRSVITVSSLNCNAPGMSDVLEQGDSLLDSAGNIKFSDDFIAEDWVIVEFFNKPYNGLITTEPGFAHGDFIVDRYTIAWTRPGGGPVLATRDEQTSIIVPSGEFGVGSIRLVSFADKQNPIIGDLCYDPVFCPSFGQVIFMTANITLYGHEAGTDRETAIDIRLSVEFVDLVIETDDKEPLDCIN